MEAVDHFAVLMNTTWLYECTSDFLFQHDMLNVHVLSNNFPMSSRAACSNSLTAHPKRSLTAVVTDKHIYDEMMALGLLTSGSKFLSQNYDENKTNKNLCLFIT